MNSVLFKTLPTNYSFTNHIYLIYIHIYICVCARMHVCVYVCEQDLALNNLQGLICYKKQPTNL